MISVWEESYLYEIEGAVDPAFSGDGQTLFASVLGDDGIHPAAFDASTGIPLEDSDPRAAGQPTRSFHTHDSSRYAIQQSDNTLHIRGQSSPHEILVLQGVDNGRLRCLAFTADDQDLLAVYEVIYVNGKPVTSPSNMDYGPVWRSREFVRELVAVTWKIYRE